MQKWIQIALALFLAPAALQAQNGTGGRIVGGLFQSIANDTAHLAEEPIPGGTVRVLETPFTAPTNDRGEFILGPLPAGTYVVEARRIGYRPERRTVQVVNGRDVELDLHLLAAPITVDALTVEALQDQGQRTYDLSELQKVPLVGTANVTAVTLRQIKQVHAKDPWDLVREATGLEVHEQGQGPGFASDAVIRGFTSDHSGDVALTLDGVPINEPINGHGEGYADWNLIFPGALADVQVVKGPISPLFGNFASGGAVNVTTQASTRQTNFQAEGGSHIYGAGTLTTGFEKGAWGAFFGAHAAHSDGWRDNSAYGAAQVVGRINRRVTPDFLVDLGLQYYGTKWDSPGFLTLDQFNAGELTGATDPTDGGTKRRYQGRLSAVVSRSNFQWQNVAWGYGSRWQLYLTIPELGGEGEGIGTQSEELDNRGGAGAKSVGKWTLGSAEITAGVDAQWQLSRYNRWASVARRRDVTLIRVKGVFTSEAGILGVSKTFGRKLRLETAARVEALQPQVTDQVTLLKRPAESQIVPQPKFGAVYYATGELQFYASAARGFRNAPGTITDPTKPPVTEWAYEAGGRFSVKKFDGSLAFFRLDTRNEFVYNPVTLLNENSGHSTREGIEAEMKARVAPQLELEAHVTFNTKGVFFLTDTAGLAGSARIMPPLLSVTGGTETASPAKLMHDVGNSARVGGVADYSGRAGFTIRPTPTLWLNTWATVMGPYVPLGEPDEKTDAFAVTNMQAGARLTDRIELTLGMDNILNTRAPELRASGAVNPISPRTAHLSVNTRF